MSTVVNGYGTATGAKIRTIHVRNITGMKFISARASMGGKRLNTVKGRTIKVDLRGKSVGKYRVFITAKYKANDTVHTIRSIRTLSITR